MDCIPVWHTFCHHFETSRATQARWVHGMRQPHATWRRRCTNATNNWRADWNCQLPQFSAHKEKPSGLIMFHFDFICLLRHECHPTSQIVFCFLFCFVYFLVRVPVLSKAPKASWTLWGRTAGWHQGCTTAFWVAQNETPIFLFFFWFLFVDPVFFMFKKQVFHFGIWIYIPDLLGTTCMKCKWIWMQIIQHQDV